MLVGRLSLRWSSTGLTSVLGRPGQCGYFDTTPVGGHLTPTDLTCTGPTYTAVLRWNGFRTWNPTAPRSKPYYQATLSKWRNERADIYFGNNDYKTLQVRGLKWRPVEVSPLKPGQFRMMRHELDSSWVVIYSTTPPLLKPALKAHGNGLRWARLIGPLLSSKLYLPSKETKRLRKTSVAVKGKFLGRPGAPRSV
ncbi:hypothetical protein AVEN_103052-1 [Araneus ventricosus]|uniref:Uncharacterized protein n=1 Tax=Araneus ventricosus TaxID=182803 RepID=A0A4Y2BAQ3_ARAVE|nr:hypothetical protein AVEN_103052-1 [Araneus ventricosus]